MFILLHKCIEKMNDNIKVGRKSNEMFIQIDLYDVKLQTILIVFLIIFFTFKFFL